MNHEKFEFKGDWKFAIESELLDKINSDFQITLKKNIRLSHLNKELVTIEIIDEIDLRPDPTDSQLQTIEYIYGNLQTVLPVLMKLFNTEINLLLIENEPEAVEYLPTVSKIEELGKLMRIKKIRILPEQKNGSSYYEIIVEYIGWDSYDYTIILHTDEIKGYSITPSMGYECIAADLGISVNDIFYWNRNYVSDRIHIPHNKYGKLKPWQELATEKYLSKLLKERQNESFVIEIENNNWDINHRFYTESLVGMNCVDLASNNHNPEMIQYLVSNGGDLANSIEYCVGYNFDEESIKILVLNGASIDFVNDNNYTVLYQEILDYISSSKISKQAISKEKIEALRRKMKISESRIILYLEMGANPNNCDGQMNCYDSLLKKRHSIEYLDNSDAFSELKKIILINKI